MEGPALPHGRLRCAAVACPGCSSAVRRREPPRERTERRRMLAGWHWPRGVVVGRRRVRCIRGGMAGGGGREGVLLRVRTRPAALVRWGSVNLEGVGDGDGGEVRRFPPAAPLAIREARSCSRPCAAGRPAAWPRMTPAMMRMKDPAVRRRPSLVQPLPANSAQAASAFSYSPPPPASQKAAGAEAAAETGNLGVTEAG